MLKLNKEEVHFLVTAEMKKEVADFLEAVDAKIAPVLEYIKEIQVERVCFIGCGSSSAAGSTAKYLADKYTTLTVNAYTGWEFVDSMPVYGDRKTLAVFISQSGTTEEIVEGLRKARNQGFMTVGVCNEREDNPLGMEADYVVDYHAEAMWECQLVALYTLIARMALERGESTEIMEKILSDMKRLPEVLGHHIENFEAKAMEMTKPLRNLKGFYTVSASSMVPLAYKEGVITGMEFLWSHGAVIQAGEFRHGPLEIVESGVPFLFLVPTDSSRVITQRALKFVEKWKGTAIVLDYADFAMGLHDDLAPFVMFVPLEWFCYYFSIVRDHNPDDRRYYGVVEY